MTWMLKINLDTYNTEEVYIGEMQKEYIGGLGLNTKLAWDLIPESCSPFDKENHLIIGVGSLVGSLLPTACRTDITSKSPLSGRFGSSNSGGRFGVQLCRAGYYHLAIKGKSQDPVVLYIDDGHVYLEEAAHLWGEDTWFTCDWIKHNKGKDFEVASIGPAGENLVAFASIQNGYDNSWGRTGMGAVMGSKNLKAIAVRGKKKHAFAHEKNLKIIKQEAFTKVKEDESFPGTKKYGSMIVSSPFNNIGGLPGLNYTTGFFQDWETTRGRKAFVEKYKERDLACYSCPLACAHWSRVKEGPFINFAAKGPEVTFVLEFGARLNIQSIPEILKCVELCNRYGLDVISSASSIAFLLESFQNNLIPENEFNFTPAFGNFYSIKKLLHLIAFREGPGELLSAGVKQAASKVRGSEKYALHIKGVGLSCRDPRAKPDVWALGYLTNTRGGDHLRIRSPVEYLYAGNIDYEHEELGVSSHQVKKLDMPTRLKTEIFGSPPSHVHIPRMIKYAEELITIINSTGLCIRPPVLRTLGPDFFARALNAALDTNFTAESLLRTASQVWDLQHNFNLREGEKEEEYCFPSRFYQDYLKREEGGFHPPLSEKRVSEVVKKYFNIRNWFNM